MGANDSEKSDIAFILKRLDEDKGSPEEAKKKANEVLESKQDYH